MTREAAVEIARMIDRHWSMYLFAEGEQGAEVWINYLVRNDDVAMVMEAVTALAERQPARPTVADLRGTIDRMNVERRLAMPALPEPEFAREVPEWYKGWLVARASNDHRVWPQQKAGYDNLQNEHDHYRTYVWPEQEEMPEDERSRHEQRGAGLSAAQLGSLLTSIGLGKT